jgi:hypothetical protein
VWALVLVGEVAGDETVIRPGDEVGPQGRMLRAFGCRAGGGGLVERAADLGGGGGETIQHGPPSGDVPGVRQFVERAASGIEQCTGVRGEVLGNVRTTKRWYVKPGVEDLRGVATVWGGLHGSEATYRAVVRDCEI